MKFTIKEDRDSTIEIKTPSFYTHQGVFYKLTDTLLLTVGEGIIMSINITMPTVERNLKSIENGEYGEISQGMFIDQFDKVIESFQKLRT